MAIPEPTGLVDALGLAVFGRDAHGAVVAGLCGHTWGGCCEIRQVWVHEKHREQGIGRRLLELAETEARCEQWLAACWLTGAAPGVAAGCNEVSRTDRARRRGGAPIR